MEKGSLALGGAFGASLLIGACCVGPAVFLLLGVSIGGLGVLSSLEPYRPLFIAAGAGALLYAARRAWRPAEVNAAECSDGACVADSAGRRRLRVLVTFVGILYALAVAYPYAIGALV